MNNTKEFEALKEIWDSPNQIERHAKIAGFFEQKLPYEEAWKRANSEAFSIIFDLVLMPSELKRAIAGCQTAGATPPFAETIVEWGCGEGRLLRAMRILTSANLVGVDISWNSIQEAQEKTEGASFYLSPDGVNCGIVDDAVDLVYSYTVLQHIPTREMIQGVMREMFRILRRGGYARLQTLLGEPCKDFLGERGFRGHLYPNTGMFLEDMRAAGFEIVCYQVGLGYKDWLWVTGRKP